MLRRIQSCSPELYRDIVWYHERVCIRIDRYRVRGLLLRRCKLQVWRPDPSTISRQHPANMTRPPAGGGTRQAHHYVSTPTPYYSTGCRSSSLGRVQLHPSVLSHLRKTLCTEAQSRSDRYQVRWVACTGNNRVFFLLFC